MSGYNQTSESEDRAEMHRRRMTRKEQRELLDDIHDNRNKIVDVKSDKFQRLHARNVKISEGARETRELQNDAFVIRELSYCVREQASSLNDVSVRFNFDDLLLQVRRRYGSSSTRVFPWKRLGREAGSLFNTPPGMTPMLGALRREVKERVQHVRRADAAVATCEETKVEEIINEEDSDGDVEQEATNRRVKALMTFLQGDKKKRKTDSLLQSQSSGVTDRGASDVQAGPEHTKVERVDLLRSLVDPESVVQSIENFFDFSFLIKVCAVCASYPPCWC